MTLTWSSNFAKFCEIFNSASVVCLGFFCIVLLAFDSAIITTHCALASSNCVVKRQADKANQEFWFPANWYLLIPGEECCSLQSSSVLLRPNAPLFTWPYCSPFLLGLNWNNHYLRYCHNPIVTRVVVLHRNGSPVKSRWEVGCPKQQFEFGLRTSLNQVKWQAFWKSSFQLNDESSRRFWTIIMSA